MALDLSCLIAPTQVLLRWATQRGIAVIPKSNDIQRITENSQCNSFSMEESEIKAISALNQNIRVRPSFYRQCLRKLQFICAGEQPRRHGPPSRNLRLRWSQYFINPSVV